MMKASLSRIGTGFRLERNRWPMKKLRRHATNGKVPRPPLPLPSYSCGKAINNRSNELGGCRIYGEKGGVLDDGTRKKEDCHVKRLGILDSN